MDAIANLLGTALSYIQTIGIWDAIDILIVAYLIYQAINFVRRTNSKNVARGILILVLLHWWCCFSRSFGASWNAWAAVLLQTEAFPRRNWRPQFLRSYRPVWICRRLKQAR